MRAKYQILAEFFRIFFGSVVIQVMIALLFCQPLYAQEVAADSVSVGTGSFDEGPDGDPFADPIEIRQQNKLGEQTDSILSEKFDPIHKVWDPIADKLRENNLDITFQYTSMTQNSDDLIPGIENNLSGAQDTQSSGDADLAIKYHAYNPGEAMAGYFRLSAEHRHAYSEQPAAVMGAQVGSLWPTMRGWNDYTGVALTEAYWHQGTLDSPFEYRIGRVKNTTIWNGGKYIGGNDGFVGGGVTGTPALITLSSGWSIDTVYHPVGGNTHIAAGIFQANNDNQEFKSLEYDQLVYALQLGWKPEFMGEKGRYHIFTWHVDETSDTTSANGFAINAEHNFGNWTPFIRYSFGDQDRSDDNSHPIRQSANIGLGYNNAFGQSKDWLAIAGTWAEPTDETLRDQYGVEIDYSFRLTPHIILTPHIQLIYDPSYNPSKNSVQIIGLRSKIEF